MFTMEISTEQIIRNEISESKGNYRCNFVRWCPILLHRDSIKHFALQSTMLQWDHISTALLTGCFDKLWHFCHSDQWEIVSLCSFIINAVEHLFISIKAICLSFSMNSPLMSFAQFSFLVFVFWIFKNWSRKISYKLFVIYIFVICPLILSIFSQNTCILNFI